METQKKKKKKIRWVAWERVIAPKCVGGLGLGSIKALNISLLVKLWWKLKACPNALWAVIVRGFHCLQPADSIIKVASGMSGTWKNIVRCKAELGKINIKVNDIIKGYIGDGSLGSDFVRDDEFSVSLLRSRIEKAAHIVCDGHFLWSK